MKEKTITIRCFWCKKHFQKKYRIYRKAIHIRSRFFCSIKCLKSWQSKLYTKHPKIPPHKCLLCINEFRGKCKLCKQCRKKYCICSLCKTIFKKDIHSNHYCKECRSKYRVHYWVLKKIKAIIFLGQKCADCRFDGLEEYFLMDFHHRDPKEKDVNWDNLRKRTWIRITKELRKCDLLCVMCHRRRHHAIGNGSCSSHIDRKWQGAPDSNR